MNLISCVCCGVVLDKDKLIFPDTHDDEYELIEENVKWNNDEHSAFISCPVCEHAIIQNDD